MKKILILLAIICPLMLSTTACSNSGSAKNETKEEKAKTVTKNESSIIGTWAYCEYGDCVYYKFNKDHTISIWVDNEDGSDSLRWSLNGNQLTLHGKNEKEKLTFTISINGDKMELSADGETVTLQRED